MGEVVNLRRARKARNRKEAEATAAANRVAHGRNAADQAADRSEAARRDALLDGARRQEGSRGPAPTCRTDPDQPAT